MAKSEKVVDMEEVKEKDKVQEELESLVSQYNDSVKQKQHFHDMAQKCLGAIEVLQKINSEE